MLFVFYNSLPRIEVMHMKICHLTSVHKADDTRIFHKECVSLANAGYDTYLAVCGENDEKKGVHIIGTGEQSKSRLKRMWADTKKVYSAALDIDADIYHIHDPELLPYAVKLKKHGKKVIFDSHELYPTMMSVKPYIPKFARGLVAAIYRRYETRCVKKLDAVIFPCLIDGKHPFEGRCRRTVLIDNYPIINDVAVYPEAIGNSICYVGSLTQDRGITNLVRAAHKSGVKLVLAGTFAPSLYKDEIFAMPEAECVDYIGQIPQESVRDVISKSKIGVSLLRNIAQYIIAGNFPTKVYDYWMVGRPVIMSDTPYNTKTNAEINGGICVNPEDTDAIADAITELINNPEKAREMGENGKNATVMLFSWKHEEEKLINLYKEIEAEI